MNNITYDTFTREDLSVNISRTSGGCQDLKYDPWRLCTMTAVGYEVLEIKYPLVATIDVTCVAPVFPWRNIIPV